MAESEQSSVTGSFVNLHTHTHYSLLDGLQKVPQMLDRVKDLGMDAVAITDHGTLSGVIEFYKEAKARDIRPIIGIETYVAPRKHTDKDPVKDKLRYHLIILAMNEVGYRNLMKLSSIANLDGFYHKPRIDHDLLEKYNEGLIVLSGCIGGEVGDKLRNNQDEDAKKTAKWYKSVFGDRYYLEVQDHGYQWEEQERVNNKVLVLGDELDIPVVLTSDAHYAKHTDQEAHEALLCIQTGSFLADTNRMSLKNTDLFIPDPQDMIDRWKNHPEVISNTVEIAKRCHVEIQLGGILIPKFPVPKGEDERSYLHKMVYSGLLQRYNNEKSHDLSSFSVEQAKKKLSEEVLERVEFELGVIGKMGFDGYFLIVQDFINWGKEREIVFGPGRGSAAGSIVAYAINITDLDPLKYDLLFERFLNPDRISMPDIDIDIQDTRRDEVIQYCVEKYGQDQVAHIVTFGTMAARNAIRDVARVLEVSYADADRLAKMVPAPVQGRHIPLAESIQEDKELKAEYENNPTSKRVIDLAVQLEGTIRSHGVHAAGVVIAPDEIVQFTPLEMAQKGVVTTQYPMFPVEELGLLKMDFLGLSNLTIIKNGIRIIKKVYDQTIDVSEIPLDDMKTYELFGRGDTTGVFQLESAGMKRYIKQLQPTRFEDIIAMVALYRPGPMQFIDDFIDRKHGKKKIEYLHPKMKDALENTYGILVYQEQVMQIAKDMCGFTGGQADTLRKAIGKKIASLMAKLKQDFIEGGIKHSNADKAMMEEFWQQLEEFAAYAFNKSHAACYGLIAYWTAYLKAHYPSAFMAALMTSDYDDTDRLAVEITECQHMGIEVLQPDINESFLEFAVVPKTDQIRFGMAAIKNVGTGAVDEILKERKNGKFTSIEDFASRVSTRVVNRKVWESLIKSGAFDQFENRDTLLHNLDTILAFATKLHKEKESGQTDLFGQIEGENKPSVTVSLHLENPQLVTNEREKLQWERDLLGIFLSKHPLDEYQTYFEEQLIPLTSVGSGMDGKSVTVGGMITTVREITTKKGAKMAFVGLEDKHGELELIVFPDAFAQRPDLWQKDKIVTVEGKVNTKDREGRATDEIKVLVDTASEITHEMLTSYKPTGKKKKAPAGSGVSASTRNDIKKRLYVHVKKPDDGDRLLELKKVLSANPGDCEAVLVLGEKDKTAVKLPFKVTTDKQIIEQIALIYEPDCIAIR